MNNPEAMRQMLSPENMQAMVQMQQAMQQLQGTGLVPPGAGGRAGGGLGGELCWLTEFDSDAAQRPLFRSIFLKTRRMEGLLIIQ